MVPAKTTIAMHSAAVRDMELELRIEDIAEGPDHPETFRRSREVNPADDRRAQPHPETHAAAVVKPRDVDLALQRDDLARVAEQRHVEGTERVPPMLDAQVDRMIVLEAVRGVAS